MKNKGFVGLGVMGSPLAGHISKAGYDLTVFNRTREKSEHWKEEYSGEIALSPAELAEGCDMVFLCVGNNQDVEEVVLGKNGLLKSLKPGGIIIHIGLTQPSGAFDFRKATLQEITFIGTYCYTNKDFEKTIGILTNKKIGSLNWIKYKKLKEGSSAFKEIHNGTCAAPKIILLI